MQYGIVLGLFWRPGGAGGASFGDGCVLGSVLEHFGGLGWREGGRREVSFGPGGFNQLPS